MEDTLLDLFGEGVFIGGWVCTWTMHVGKSNRKDMLEVLVSGSCLEVVVIVVRGVYEKFFS